MKNMRAQKLQKMFSKLASTEKVAQDVDSEFNALMGRLTGDTLSSSPEPKAEITEPDLGGTETYQMPVKGGRSEATERIMKSIHSDEFTKDNWIVGTFIPGRDINKKHRHGHNGIDVAVHPDLNGKVPAYPIASGEVIKVATGTSKGGNTVTIAHTGEDKRVVSYYAHLASVSVSPGQEVTPTTEIGKVGNTGNAIDTAPHVHLEVWVDGKHVDPMKVMGQPVGSLAKKATAIKETLQLIQKYARSRKECLESILKKG
jgi:murein DD-endopeptidase MepM/ murein hydrolase activator NlpD